MKKQFSVIVKTPSKDIPRHYELSAAKLVAEYFKTDVIFLRPIPMKSPDLEINGIIWELKSPTGNSKNTIHNNFKEARRKTINIIIDLRRCKINESNAFARIQEEIRKRKRRKGKILVIDRKGQVLDFSQELRYNKNIRY